jgi:hypothetical protein
MRYGNEVNFSGSVFRGRVEPEIDCMVLPKELRKEAS